MTEELFVPYNEALALKKLGFNEPCLSYYKNGEFSDILELVKNSEMEDNNSITEYIAAPLYQQAFKFFRENYKLLSFISMPINKVDYAYEIKNISQEFIEGYLSEMQSGVIYNTYEEAELTCLRKLIKIVND